MSACWNSDVCGNSRGLKEVYRNSLFFWTFLHKSNTMCAFKVDELANLKLSGLVKSHIYLYDSYKAVIGTKPIAFNYLLVFVYE